MIAAEMKSGRRWAKNPSSARHRHSLYDLQIPWHCCARLKKLSGAAVPGNPAAQLAAAARRLPDVATLLAIQPAISIHASSTIIYYMKGKLSEISIID